jgi:hypothetical protein
LSFFSLLTRRKPDKLFHIVVLRRLVTALGTAFFASMYNNEAFFRVGLTAYGAHYTAAVRRPVARHNIKMQGAEAFGTMIARAVAKRRNLVSAVGAYKARIVLFESFIFHIFTNKYRGRAMLAPTVFVNRYIVVISAAVGTGVPDGPFFSIYLRRNWQIFCLQLPH